VSGLPTIILEAQGNVANFFVRYFETIIGEDSTFMTLLKIG